MLSEAWSFFCLIHYIKVIIGINNIEEQEYGDKLYPYRIYFEYGRGMWKSKFAKYILEKLILKQGISDNDKIVYLYGLTEGITIIENIVITLLIGFISGNMIQTIIFLLMYIPLRSYAGGYHARTEKLCFIYSIVLIIVVEIYFSYFFYINNMATLLTASLSAFYIWIYSPFESESKLLTSMEKAHYKQIVNMLLVLEVILMILCGLFKLTRIFSGIVAAIFIEAMLIIFGKVVMSRRRT